MCFSWPSLAPWLTSCWLFYSSCQDDWPHTGITWRRYTDASPSVFHLFPRGHLHCRNVGGPWGTHAQSWADEAASTLCSVGSGQSRTCLSHPSDRWLWSSSFATPEGFKGHLRGSVTGHSRCTLMLPPPWLSSSLPRSPAGGLWGNSWVGCLYTRLYSKLRFGSQLLSKISSGLSSSFSSFLYQNNWDISILVVFSTIIGLKCG